MTVSSFNHVKISGVKTVIPENYVDIDDELEFFGNNPKKLERAKKMVGYGRRYLADELTTVTDLAVDAAEKLFEEMSIDKNDIDILIFVNQKPDFREPNDACIAHGRLGLKKSCATLPIVLGCSGYPYGLWLASALMQSGFFKKCLLLAGDVPARATDQKDRKKAQIFSDGASATILEYTSEERLSYFVNGSDGGGWDKLVVPFGGMRLPFDKASFDIEETDENGNKWRANLSLMKGADVFNFTMDVAPKLINEILDVSGWAKDDVDLYAIHQANKQIVENIIAMSKIPEEKTPVDVFSKYANSSTNSVVTVVCDQQKPLKKVVLCAFGVGLSWGAAAVDLSGMYNGGISTYIPPKDRPTREEQIKHWINYFKGEE